MNIFFTIILLIFVFPISQLQLYAHSITAVVFDCGGVVAQPDHHHIICFISQKLNISMLEAETVLKAAHHDYRQGGNPENFWNQYASEHAVTLPLNWYELLSQAWVDAFEYTPGIIELVHELKENGFQVAMLSNVKSEHAFLIQKKGMYELFDPVILSCGIGLSKPDLKAYEFLIKTLNIEPVACLFIDDSITNIEAAQFMGINGIHFFNVEQLKEELLRREIISR